MIRKLIHEEVIYSFFSENYLCLFQTTMESYLEASEYIRFFHFFKKMKTLICGMLLVEGKQNDLFLSF